MDIRTHGELTPLVVVATVIHGSLYCQVYLQMDYNCSVSPSLE
jgi:hypothetical protein